MYVLLYCYQFNNAIFLNFKDINIIYYKSVGLHLHYIGGYYRLLCFTHSINRAMQTATIKGKWRSTLHG